MARSKDLSGSRGTISTILGSLWLQGNDLYDTGIGAIYFVTDAGKLHSSRPRPTARPPRRATSSCFPQTAHNAQNMHLETKEDALGDTEKVLCTRALPWTGGISSPLQTMWSVCRHHTLLKSHHTPASVA